MLIAHPEGFSKMAVAPRQVAILQPDSLYRVSQSFLLNADSWHVNFEIVTGAASRDAISDVIEVFGELAKRASATLASLTSVFSFPATSSVHVAPRSPLGDGPVAPSRAQRGLQQAPGRQQRRACRAIKLVRTEASLRHW